MNCAICAEHRGEGPLTGRRSVWRDDLVAVFHASGPALGHLYVESLRHAPSVAGLTGEEAAATGVATTALARALRADRPAGIRALRAGTRAARSAATVMPHVRLTPTGRAASRASTPAP